MECSARERVRPFAPVERARRARGQGHRAGDGARRLRRCLAVGGYARWSCLRRGLSQPLEAESTCIALADR